MNSISFHLRCISNLHSVYFEIKKLTITGPRNINWNLTRSAFEKLYLNQVKTFAISNSKFDKTFRKSVSQQYNLLSSANSHISDLIWRRKRALEKIIKSVGLKIDPGCIPVIMPSQELKEDSVLVHCLRLLGWSKIISKFILSKLYAFYRNYTHFIETIRILSKLYVFYRNYTHLPLLKITHKVYKHWLMKG